MLSGRDVEAVFVAKQIFQEDLQGKREAPDVKAFSANMASL